MPFPTMPDPIANRESEAARRHPDPERETLELAAAGAAQVLGPDHGVTKALAKAAITMAKADLWWARLAVKMLRRDQRAAIAGPWRRPTRPAGGSPSTPPRSPSAHKRPRRLSYLPTPVRRARSRRPGH